MPSISRPPLSGGVVLTGPVSEVILVTVLATIQNNAICPTNSLLLPLQIFWTAETTQTCPQDASQFKLKKTTLFAGQQQFKLYSSYFDYNRVFRMDNLVCLSDFRGGLLAALYPRPGEDGH